MRILVGDDDPQIREVVTIALERAGFQVLTAADGTAILRAAQREAPALIVLDIGLPELDGLEVCRRLRAQSAVPILFLTARDDEIDRVLGLELGADDYVTKPFSPRELVARVKAILNRAGGARSQQVLEYGHLRLDPARHDCRVANHPVALTQTEAQLLARLLQRPGDVVRRPQLVAAVWGAGSDIADRTLDSHLRNLRAKLQAAGLPNAIETLHGVGIRMGQCDLS
jgi:two-component system, OmpR family, response regulator